MSRRTASFHERYQGKISLVMMINRTKVACFLWDCEPTHVLSVVGRGTFFLSFIRSFVCLFLCNMEVVASSPPRYIHPSFPY